MGFSSGGAMPSTRLTGITVPPETVREREAKKLIPPLHGALLKNEQDVHLFEKLAFLTRRERQ